MSPNNGPYVHKGLKDGAFSTYITDTNTGVVLNQSRDANQNLTISSTVS